MISRHVNSSPTSGSVLTAQSLEPASESVSPSLSLPLLSSRSLALSKINKHQKKIVTGNLSLFIPFIYCTYLSTQLPSGNKPSVCSFLCLRVWLFCLVRKCIFGFKVIYSQWKLLLDYNKNVYTSKAQRGTWGA